MVDIFVNQISVSGVKNLDANCTIDFSLKGRIKAIYGTNGAGKTALMLGVRILQRLLLDDRYLVEARRPLLDIINKSSKRVSLFVVFSVDEKKYQYDAILKVVGSDVLIASERLSAFGRGKDKTLVFAAGDGLLSTVRSPNAEEVVKQTMNLLSRSSFSSIFAAKNRQGDRFFISELEQFQAMSALISFANRISVYLMPGDLPAEPYDLSTKKDIPAEITEKLASISEHNRHKELAFIAKKDVGNYKAMTDRFCNFIRVFKPELQKIDVDVREVDKGVVSVERIFDYGSGRRINSYMESTGIRSLMDIYPFLFVAVNGGIVFVDELDGNINGVMLSSLIQYLSRFAKGQLCFTSHDSSLMASLQENKYGISFLSPESGIRAWVKNGHYDPESQWIGGFVPGFPFNYEPLDFYSAFAPIVEA